MVNVQQCPTCGKQLDSSVRFCPDDGTPLTETAARTGPQPTPTGGRAPSSMHIELPALVGGRYRLIEARGGGGMARVYRAIDTTLERDVAVKIINPELRTEPEFDARFQREARIASQLADPHIVVVHDFGIDPTLGPYLVMEFLQGQSLRERLAASGPIPLRAALQLGGQVMLALIHAHGKGIVHRDIKPDNIFLLNQSGVRLHVRVLDFGIARIYRRDDPERAETLTRPGAVLGTPRYMSPEQLAGQTVDARSDLYSAAMVIHESLTGKLPYVSGKKLCELCAEAPAALQDLLDHCLKQNPAERPATAVEVYLRLQELGKASGVLLLPPGAMEKLLAERRASTAAQEPTVDYVPTASRRRRLILTLAAAVGLIVLGLAIWAGIAYFGSRNTPPPPPGQETLGGLKIGDGRDDVVAKLGKPSRDFQVEAAPGIVPDQIAIGRVLTREDLGPPNMTDRFEVLHYADDQLGFIVRENAVLAITVHARHKAPTARGLDVGDSEEQLIHLYPEVPTSVRGVDASKESIRPIKVYRFDSLGIGFEVANGHVAAITLYRAVKAAAPSMTGD
jgi:tRNA A-37 threonylcarbamoyl transferase component Bud32